MNQRFWGGPSLKNLEKWQFQPLSHLANACYTSSLETGGATEIDATYLFQGALFRLMVAFIFVSRRHTSYSHLKQKCWRGLHKLDIHISILSLTLCNLQYLHFLKYWRLEIYEEIWGSGLQILTAPTLTLYQHAHSFPVIGKHISKFNILVRATDETDWVLSCSVSILTAILPQREELHHFDLTKRGNR